VSGFVVVFLEVLKNLCSVSPPRKAKAIDRYIQLRCQELPGKQKLDHRLQAIIEGIFKQCIDEEEYKQVNIFFSWSLSWLTISIHHLGNWNRSRVSSTGHHLYYL
jgi:hypothetical protein